MGTYSVRSKQIQNYFRSTQWKKSIYEFVDSAD